MRIFVTAYPSLLLSVLVSSLVFAGGSNANGHSWPVVLNELMAGNDSFVLDDHGGYDDWIELHNSGQEAIDVAGCYLSDDPDNPAKWQIPASDSLATTIPAHGYLLIWADEEPGQGPLHAGFKLAAGGESVALYDPAMALLDEVAFSRQASNESYARIPDGDGPWQVCASPTPGQANDPDPGDVVISEIMYHPRHKSLTSEDTAREWIEIFNPGAEPVALAGWKLADAVDFVFPDVRLEAGAYLVVAADADTFRAQHPDVANVLGGWAGWLSNSGERLTLANAAGAVVDSIEYADEGDWVARELGPSDHGHRGWQWSDEIDGGGKSLELIDAARPNEFGQNWAASLENEGTSGRANSVAASNGPPIIMDVRHSPLIPKPDDSVMVTARVIGSAIPQASVRLRYRQDHSSYTTADSYPQANPDDFTVVAMFDDGAHDDGHAGDGVYGAQIPPHTDGAVVEFYVEAFDGDGRSRTWPAPSLVDGQWEQVTNALYRVDSALDADSYWQIGGKPLYYVVMTEMERGRLARIGSRSNGEEDTNAAMNGTFISIDGTGASLCYRAAVRNRGHGTRTGPPNNFHVAFPRDGLWKGRSAINFNCRYTHVQILGSAIFRMAGLAAADAVAAELRINGADLAQTGSSMYGVYVRLDAFDDDFAERHFRDDPNGNLYTCYRLDSGAAEAELRYEGSDPNAYRDRYFKANHVAQDDWSDLIHMVDVLNNAPEATYLQEVGEVINLRQWLRYIAVDSLLLNYETGLNMGMGDDYYLYCGAEDHRFVLVPHDLDTILDQGNAHASINLSVLSIVEGAPGRNGVQGLKRLFDHPEVVALYHSELADLIDTVFSPERFDPLVDHVLGGWTPEAVLRDIKQFVVERNAAVLAQIASADMNSLLMGSGDPSLTTASAGQLVINEVLANNESAVAREGAFPDLVELYNGSSQAISLSGVSLSDDPQQPAKFVFPADATMNPGEYLVLTADDGVAPSASHLGFGLDAEGDGLSLYDATGERIDSVEFGSQVPDSSIGRLGPDGAWQLTVPTFGQANVPQPLGDPGAIRINEWLASEKVLFESDFIELYNPDPLPVAVGGFYLTDLPSVDPGPRRLRPLSFIAGQGYVVLAADDGIDPGHLGFKLSSDGDLIVLYDASYKPVDAVIFFPQTTDVSQGRLPDGTWRFEYFVLPTPGLPNAGFPEPTVTTFGLVSEDAAKRAIVPTSVDQIADDWKSRLDFDDSAWLSVSGAPGGVGYERSSGYELLIGLDVEEAMYGHNATCYVRIPFAVEGDPSETFSELYLSIRYDDGFVAYLNGTEVARINASETLQWDSAATGSHNASDSGFDEIVDLSDRMDLLHPGDNLLAIQGLNVSVSGSSDFLIMVALDGMSEEVTGGEYPYWNELDLLDGLRVTELMYNAPEGDMLDYIELRNVTTSPLDLTGVRFTAGIDFTFPTMTLAPGEYVVVAGDLAAFRERYGADIHVAGRYAGHLSDSGETLVLKLALPLEAAILRFRYSAAWQPATDGGGVSLVIKDATAAPASWNEPESWQSSSPSPGKP